ncbi:MAG: dienelactone hydrolase family protein [Phycisphaerales bacterium]
MPRLLSIVLLTLAVVASMSNAAVKVERIEYKHGDVVLEGVLAYDDDLTGRRPGVLVCHEWWGNNAYSESRARQLAGLGYVAFALDLYGKGKVTTKGDQAAAWAGALSADNRMMRERAALGLKQLAEHPRVDKTKLAVVGYCMGGTVAMELARSGLEHTQNLKAVVPFHASTVSAADGREADNANIKGAVLVCHGAADEFVPKGEIARFEKQMAEAKVDYQVLSLGGAVHAFTNPAADGSFSPMVRYDAKADARSWTAMKALFEETLK